MGIKGLWTILAPFSEKKSLHEIRGETVAIDLSGWVCDSQNVTDFHIQPRLYLRTLYLLLSEINPVFVLEGDAPDLKRDVMAARNAIQFKGTAAKTQSKDKPGKKPDISRKRFHNVLRECEQLLKSMGVRCIKGQGEAEATCALLNAKGVVNAVVSQDSDCFAYGAKRVYRNFSVSKAAGGGSLQGSVDCYDATQMFIKNGFGRNKMVALGLLCGCDYGVGACGSSIGTVVAFLHTVLDTDIIPRLVSWVSDPEQYEEMHRWTMTPGQCDCCGHGGRSHGRNGCPTCGTNKGCKDNGHKAKKAEVKRELSLRQRAVTCGVPFPEPKIMKEFFNRPEENIDIEQLNDSAPSLIEFTKLMRIKLGWNERYCVEKFLPVLTRWHLQNGIINRTIKPIVIKKKRKPKGVPSYEVVWSDIDGQYDGLIPDDQFEEGEDPDMAWTSVERQDLMTTFYAELVNAFEDSLKKPTKLKKPITRKKIQIDNSRHKPKRKYNKKKQNIENDMDDVHKSIANISISNRDSSCNVSVKVNRLKRKFKADTMKAKNQRTLDSFISKRRKSMKKLMNSLRNSFQDSMNFENRNCEELGVGKENVLLPSMDLLSLSCDDIPESELSDIVDNILNTAPVTKIAMVNNNLVKLRFTKKVNTPQKTIFRKSVFKDMYNNKNCSTPINSPIKVKTHASNISADQSYSKINKSYFFDKLTEESDVLELSINYQNDEEDDKTTNYDLIDFT